MSAPSIRVRLSAMFWLVHMTDAAALVLLSGHMADLGFSGVQISYVFATTAAAALAIGAGELSRSEHGGLPRRPVIVLVLGQK